MMFSLKSYLLLAGGAVFVLLGLLLIATGSSYQVKSTAADDKLESPLLANGSIPCRKFLQYAKDEEAIRIDYSGNLKFDIEYDPKEIRPGQGLYVHMRNTFPQKPEEYKVIYVTKQGEEGITEFVRNPDRPPQMKGDWVNELSRILKNEKFKLARRSEIQFFQGGGSESRACLPQSQCLAHGAKNA